MQSMGELFGFSREDRWEHERWVPAFHDFWLRELDFNGDEGFYASPGKCDYVFFPGCQLTASLPLHTIKSFELLQKEIKTGLILGCCGAPAVWAGDKKRRDTNMEKLKSAWEAMDRPVILTACATCKDMDTVFDAVHLNDTVSKVTQLEDWIPGRIDSLVMEDSVNDPWSYFTVKKLIGCGYGHQELHMVKQNPHRNVGSPEANLAKMIHGKFDMPAFGDSTRILNAKINK